MTEALRELFNAYKHLPVMVMFFKKRELFFVNDFLRSSLSLENLSSDSILQVLGNMLEFDEITHLALFSFLCENPTVVHDNHVYQIEYKHTEEIDIFVVVRISVKTVMQLDVTHSIRMMRNTMPVQERIATDRMDGSIAKALDNWGRGTTYTSLVLYMGIPIKGLCEIVSADGAQLTILVEKKQLIATSPGTKWLITPKKGVFISGYVTKNDLYHNFVTLDKLRIIEPSEQSHFYGSVLKVGCF